jgi:hypothetical protein
MKVFLMVCSLSMLFTTLSHCRYSKCHSSNLNGLNLNEVKSTAYATGINWAKWRGYYHSMRNAEMALKPIE